MSANLKWYKSPDGNASTFAPGEPIPAGWHEFTPPSDAPGGHAASMEIQLSNARAEIAALKAEIAKVDGDGDGRVGGSPPKAPAPVVEGAVAEAAASQPAASDLSYDGMDDDDLRALVLARTGTKPHWNAGRDKLLAMLSGD